MPSIVPKTVRRRLARVPLEVCPLGGGQSPTCLRCALANDTVFPLFAGECEVTAVAFPAGIIRPSAGAAPMAPIRYRTFFIDTAFLLTRR